MISGINEQIQNKTSDEESGVFPFSERAYEIFRNITWKGNIQKGCALIIFDMVYGKKRKVNDDFKYISSLTLQDIYDDYLEILCKLEDNGLIIRIKSITSKFFTNKNFVGKCKISKEDFALYENSWKRYNNKLETKGYKSNTKNFTFDIDSNTLNKILENSLFDDINFRNNLSKEEAIKDQKIRVKYLKKGDLKPSQNSRKRCYSKFTGIIKELHPFLKINNQNTVEIDSHATFLTFLPNICRKWMNKLESDINNIYDKKEITEIDIDTITKKRELIDGTLDDIKIFESFLKETFDKNKSIYEEIASFIEGYDTNKIKKSMNSYLMSQDYTKVDRSIDLFFKTNFPKIRNIIDDMRPKNRYWSESEKFEVNIFTEVAKTLIKQNIHCITKYDGIFVEKSKFEHTLKLLHDRFEALQVYTILNIVDNESGSKTKMNHEMRSEIIKNHDEKMILEILAAPSPSDSLLKDDFCADKTIKFPNTYLKKDAGKDKEKGESLEFGNLDLIRTNRTKEISIRLLKDGRYAVSIKNKNYNSKKNETKEMFYKRLMNDVEISDENKNLIIFGECDQREHIETSVASVDVTQSDSEAISSDDYNKANNYTEISTKAPKKASSDISDNLDTDAEKMRIYKKLIEGGL